MNTRQLRKAFYRARRSIVGRLAFPHPRPISGIERFGGEYGGWYVLTNLLNSESIVYSVGIGEDASFDVALIERFGLVVNAFDPTPRSVAWVRGASLPPSFRLHELALASRDGVAPFYSPRNEVHVSHTLMSSPCVSTDPLYVSTCRLYTISQKLGHDCIDLLKMDVEGEEYAIIEDLARTPIRPVQILVEFHHRFSGVGVHKTRAAIRALGQLDYRLFAVSRTYEEFSFVLGSALSTAQAVI